MVSLSLRRVSPAGCSARALVDSLVIDHLLLYLSVSMMLNTEFSKAFWDSGIHVDIGRVSEVLVVLVIGSYA